MAARWLGLSRPNKKKLAARSQARRGIGRAIRESMHALGATGVLVMAAAMNFALHPDALAAVVRAQPAIVGFVPAEPQLRASTVEPIPVDEEEVRLLAATAWGEARSEGEDGMRAVAHVMANRVGGRFGENLETVILSPRQFSVWNRGDPNRPLVRNPERYAQSGSNRETWETAQRVAREVLSGQSVDPTNGALFYHTGAIRPWWSRYGQGRTQIGAHVFYSDVPNQPRSRRARRVTRVAQTFDPARAGGARSARGARQWRHPVRAAVDGAPVAAERTRGCGCERSSHTDAERRVDHAGGGRRFLGYLSGSPARSPSQ